MVLRHPASWPTRWLMTDERQGAALWHAVAALPRGSAVVLRHHRTAPGQRAAMLVRLGRIARRAGLILFEEVVRSNAPAIVVSRHRRDRYKTPSSSRTCSRINRAAGSQVIELAGRWTSEHVRSDGRGSFFETVAKVSRSPGCSKGALATGPALWPGSGDRKDKPTSPRIARVHNQREAIAARRAGAVAIMISPVFATRTHPGAPTLGPIRAAQIAQAARLPAIALGGMTARRFNRMQRLGFIGWAAIDGLTPPDQKRKAVPT